MGQLNFNPEDFVFYPLKSPDEKKTILEYDAKSRLILLRTKNDLGEYEYNSVHLSEVVNQNILKNIPDEWSNPNDKVVIFAIYESGEYILEKEKMKYDFSTKSTRWIRYSSESLTIEQAKELYDVIRTAIFVDQNSKEYTNATEFLELSKKNYYLTKFNEKNTEFIESFLRNSDWRVLPDYPEQFTGEKEMWITWRSKIRELDKTPEDFEDSLDYLIYLEELNWPIRPDQYNAKYPELQVGYLETEDQFIKTPEFLDDSKESDYIANIAKVSELLKKYESEGVTISSNMKQLIEKYKLIEDLKEFKTINLTTIGDN
jgi:hypothetical protein